jgi:hypothetical protein
MKLLKSKKLKLPQLYFISDRALIKDIPIGVPFIFGDPTIEKSIVRILEYEVLYQAALKSGYPFNFKKILNDNGYKDLKGFEYSHPVYMEYSTGEGFDIESDLDISTKLTKLDRTEDSMFNKYMKDSAVYVDVTKLKKLNVFPLWLDKIEEAIHTNIHNFATYNANMYNKKLEGMYGGLELASPNKNLIIIDISGSIPKAVSSTCLALAKNLSETFYADILITGSKSTLYPYEQINDLNIHTIYDENQMDNDQAWFKKLVTHDEKSYKTAIVFGDNHSPGYAWRNNFNKDTVEISQKDGQELCKWKINKLISFHTSNKKGREHVAGYGTWFTPLETEHIQDWVKYL